MKHLITVLLAGVVSVLVALGMGHQAPAPRLGALAGPDIPSSWVRWGGVAVYQSEGTLKQATTTPCAIQSPSATSTLESAAIRIDTASTTATTWDIAQAATAYATTTAIGTPYIVGANAQATIQASTSPAAGAATVLAPNTWIVFGARAGITSGDTAGTGFVPSGVCRATFTAF